MTRFYVPIGVAAVALGIITIWVGSAPGPEGIVQQVVFIAGCALTGFALLLLFMAPGIYRTALRERALRDRFGDLELFSFTSGTLLNRYVKGLSRLDGREGQFLPWYYTAVPDLVMS
jgi:hypothetical protein